MEPSILMNLMHGRILHQLVTHGPATARDISTALMLNEAIVSQALGRLLDARLVRVADTSSAAIHPAYVVDTPQVADEIAHVRSFFAPWL